MTILKNRRINIKFTAIIALVFSGISMLPSKALSANAPTDSTKLRDVQVSQQMFVTKFSPGKHKLSKGKKNVDLKSSLQGVFRVVELSGDSNHVVTDWIRCPYEGCPVMGTYTFGTPAYRRLDTMIAISKKNSLNEQKRFAKMVASKK